MQDSKPDSLEQTTLSSQTKLVPKLDGVAFYSWIALFALAIATLIYFVATEDKAVLILPRLLIVLSLSATFPLIAQSYRRFLVRGSEVKRKSEFQYFAARMPPPGGANSTEESRVKALTDNFTEEYSPKAYTICLLPAIAISIIGWSLLISPIDLVAPLKANTATDSSFQVLPPIVAKAMAIGFLGALVFSYQLLWQRLTTEDLKPSLFLRCALAMFCGITFAYIVFSATESFSAGLNAEAKEMNGAGALVGYVVAFALGYFPMMAISWFTRIANQALGEPTRRADSQRLMIVDGITTFHEERLLEEGIHNIHDLAFADVGSLLVKTPFSAKQLMDWVDQCTLLLYIEPGEAGGFRRGGIRNAVTLERVWGPYFMRSNRASDDVLTANRNRVASALQTTPERMDAVLIGLSSRETERS